MMEPSTPPAEDMEASRDCVECSMAGSRLSSCTPRHTPCKGRLESQGDEGVEEGEEEEDEEQATMLPNREGGREAAG